MLGACCSVDARVVSKRYGYTATSLSPTREDGNDPVGSRSLAQSSPGRGGWG